MTKTVLRTAMRTVRGTYVAGLTPEARERAEAALAEILTRNLGPGLVAVYAACGDELDASALPRPLAFPRVIPSRPLDFHVCPRADLAPGFRGIPEPDPGLPAVDPDIVLVPLLAVDAGGNRLGQGGGYYDRTLTRLRARRPVVAIGLAWDIQLIEAVPADPWDAPLDAVATPTRWLAIAPPSLMSPP